MTGYNDMVIVKYSGWFRAEKLFTNCDNIKTDDKIDSITIDFDQKTFFGLRHRTIHIMKKELTSIITRERIKERIKQ